MESKEIGWIGEKGPDILHVNTRPSDLGPTMTKAKKTKGLNYPNSGVRLPLRGTVNLLTVSAGGPVSQLTKRSLFCGRCMDGNNCRLYENPCGNLLRFTYAGHSTVHTPRDPRVTR